MKKGKEIKLSDTGNYNISVGTMDNKNPKSVFITISAWCNPLSNVKLDYNKVIGNLTRSIKMSLFNIPNNRFSKEHTIVDFDMRESGIRYGKKSYMCCEITLFQKNDYLPVTSEILINDVNDIISHVSKDAFNNNQYFTFHKTKK